MTDGNHAIQAPYLRIRLSDSYSLLRLNLVRPPVHSTRSLGSSSMESPLSYRCFLHLSRIFSIYRSTPQSWADSHAPLLHTHLFSDFVYFPKGEAESKRFQNVFPRSCYPSQASLSEILTAQCGCGLPSSINIEFLLFHSDRHINMKDTIIQKQS